LSEKQGQTLPSSVFGYGVGWSLLFRLYFRARPIYIIKKRPC